MYDLDEGYSMITQSPEILEFIQRVCDQGIRLCSESSAPNSLDFPSLLSRPPSSTSPAFDQQLLQGTLRTIHPTRRSNFSRHKAWPMRRRPTVGQSRSSDLLRGLWQPSGADDESLSAFNDEKPLVLPSSSVGTASLGSFSSRA
jgi:hypothetical protein